MGRLEEAAVAATVTLRALGVAGADGVARLAWAKFEPVAERDVARLLAGGTRYEPGWDDARGRAVWQPAGSLAAAVSARIPLSGEGEYAYDPQNPSGVEPGTVADLLCASVDGTDATVFDHLEAGAATVVVEELVAVTVEAATAAEVATLTAGWADTATEALWTSDAFDMLANVLAHRYLTEHGRRRLHLDELTRRRLRRQVTRIA